ncbi:4-hydroxy-3-methylbut-2-enyl diphosphate reductase [Candidatus Providencia siddallii]|uniref:4-hydroxy-3-methylbut-2-enyl diphosphate reductase n=1 Tax=Candidatus Providencia siddallii TaxID=1715285 RepID=A0ABM9NP37_9GAMM
MKILLAKPRGLCAGVKRAINIVELALKKYGAPIYVLHELVHNKYIINNLLKQGVIFIENFSEIPDNSVLIFSAHGVSKSIRQEAYSRNFNVILDATCPLVKKNHIKVTKANNKGNEVILIGHHGHPEINSTIGQYNNDKGGIYLIKNIKDVYNLKVKNINKLLFITQTTFSIDDASNIINELTKSFPNIIGQIKSDICYATINRQKAIKKIAKKSDLILIVGSKNSSNSNRLLELILKINKPAYLIDCVNDINIEWLRNIKIIGLTAGASVPNILILQILKKLKKLGVKHVIEMQANDEKMFFTLPKILK